MQLGQHVCTGIQTVADIVTIQQITLGPAIMQPPINQVGDRTFSAAAEPGEPDDTS